LKAKKEGITTNDEGPLSDILWSGGDTTVIIDWREMMIEEMMKRAFMAGLGGVVLTGDKLDALKRKLMTENKMSEKEAKGLIDEMVEAGENQWKEFESSLKEILRKRLDSMDVPDRKELEELKTRVDNLEQRVKAMESPPSSAKHMP
jgi:polyhydroxyalkanoate synthesis regulator phasin